MDVRATKRNRTVTHEHLNPDSLVYVRPNLAIASASTGPRIMVGVTQPIANSALLWNAAIVMIFWQTWATGYL